MSFRSFNDFNLHVSNATIHRVPKYLLPLALLLTTYLYLYPVFQFCAFPSTDGSLKTAFHSTWLQHIDQTGADPLSTQPHLAPFRLLVLADPQIEGDSSLPQPEDAIGNKTVQHLKRIRAVGLQNVTGLLTTTQGALAELIFEDIPGSLQAVRKRLDLFGNDYYLAHIFRTLHWWTKPTHVTVLGDLIGSQWVDDDEFEWRAWRYWNRVFAGGSRVDDETMELGRQGGGITIPMDNPDWKTKIVNIAGNHDIGYAGDISKERMERFERRYGKANWDVRFAYPMVRMNESVDGRIPTMHMVVFNSMLLDTPAMDEELQGKNYEYLNDILKHRVRPVEDRYDFTMVLTHVPLHKKEGVCVDAPMFAFWEEDECEDDDRRVNGLKEQNHLSDYASRSGVLQSIFGMGGDLDAPAQGRGRPGVVLNGHDHEGCDTWHYIPLNSTFKKSELPEEERERKTSWEATKWTDADRSIAHTSLREITLRSMMGEFGGNAGLFSAWFDFEQGEWHHEIQVCKLGVQHIWWAIHIIDLLALGSLVLSIVLRVQHIFGAEPVQKNRRSKSTKVE